MKKKIWGKKLRYAIAKSLMPFFLWLFRQAKLLGPQRLLRFSAFVARLNFRFSQKSRERGLRHLRIAFPGKNEEELQKILMASLQNAAFNAIYMALIGAGAISAKDVLEDAKAEGLEHLDAALQEGKGVILLSGHIGNFPLMCAWLAAKGYPLSVVFKDGTPSFHGFYGPWMQMMGIEPLPFKAEVEMTYTILAALRQNRMVLLVIDQTKKQAGVPILFFGKETTAAAGPALLARRAKSPIVPIFIHREGLRHVITIEPPVELVFSRDVRGDIQKHTQALSNIIEAQVVRHPEEWLWRYRRWRK